MTDYSGDYLGKDIPKLGFGLMRLPKNGDVIDIEQVKAMVDLFLASGFTYFDTAYGYEGSEVAIGEALVKRHPRESYQLTTKLPAWTAKTKDAAEQLFWTSLERTGAGYFDFYLLHNLGAHRSKFFDDYGIWDFVQKLKRDGLIRHVGFSLHDKADVLERILTEHPEMEFVQLQVNYADWESPLIESRKCYEVARAHNIPIIMMEPVKGGNLMNLPPAAVEAFKAVDPEASLTSWAIRYAASLDGIITVLSGMSSLEQMRDNIGFMSSFKPLDERERATIATVQTILDKLPAVPCTSCEYCLPVCSQNVAIPGIFEALNLKLVYGNDTTSHFTYNWNTTAHGRAKASACIECGECEAVCTQHIPIIEDLKRARAAFEDKG